MPFTSPHLYDEEDARDRAAQAVFAASSQHASSQLGDALSQMQAHADKVKADEEQQAQLGMQNKRADAQLALSQSNAAGEQEDRAARIRILQQGADSEQGARAAQTSIEQAREAREAAAAQEAITEKKRTANLGRVGAAVAAHIEKNGNNGDITPLMESVASMGLEGITPDDVAHIHADQVLAFNERAKADAGKQQNIDREIAAQQEAARHNKMLEGIEWQRNKNEMEKAKLEAASKAAGAGKLDATTASKLAGINAQIEAGQSLADRVDKIGTGRTDRFLSDVAQTIGADDPETTKFRADTANFTNGIIKELSGANVPEGEMARMREGLPQYGDPPNVYKAKLASTVEQARRLVEQYGNILGSRAPTAPAPPSSSVDDNKAHADAYFGGG